MQGDPPRRGNAVSTAHRQVHEYDIGRELGDRGNGFVSVARGSDDVDLILVRKESGESFSDNDVVVDDQQSDHPSGTSSRTNVPRSLADSTSRQAPLSTASSASRRRPR